MLQPKKPLSKWKAVKKDHAIEIYNELGQNITDIFVRAEGAITHLFTEREESEFNAELISRAPSLLMAVINQRNIALSIGESTKYFDDILEGLVEVRK